MILCIALWMTSWILTRSHRHACRLGLPIHLSVLSLTTRIRTLIVALLCITHVIVALLLANSRACAFTCSASQKVSANKCVRGDWLGDVAKFGRNALLIRRSCASHRRARATRFRAVSSLRPENIPCFSSPSVRQDMSTLNILHFNDVYRVQPFKLNPKSPETIDVTQWASMLDDVRDQWPQRPDGKRDGLVLFSGDVFSPSVESSVTRGSHMVPVMNAIGPDVSLTGEFHVRSTPQAVAERAQATMTSISVMKFHYFVGELRHDCLSQGTRTSPSSSRTRTL